MLARQMAAREKAAPVQPGRPQGIHSGAVRENRVEGLGRQGWFKTSPFDKESIEETRSVIRAAVDMKLNEDVVADGQVFHLPLMARLLKIRATRTGISR